ncbi:Uncharacterised protein [Vibrio cholerae]|nr:Uncharacterised protein [Vibrio cholerae]
MVECGGDHWLRYPRISVCDHLDYPLCQRQLFQLVSAARFSFR